MKSSRCSIPFNWVILVIAFLFIGACDSGNVLVPAEAEISGEAEISRIAESPVDVLSNFALPAAYAIEAAGGANMLANGSFENGLNGWFACGSGSKIELSGNTYDGDAAVSVSAGSCFYTSVPVAPGDELAFSCYARRLENQGWSGMGLGFSDQSWKLLDQSPSTVITSSDYSRFDVTYTAPENTTYVSMWVYSDVETLVDQCNLSLIEETSQPTPSDLTNLLENSDFSHTTNAQADGWTRFCGGGSEVIASDLGDELLVYDGACVSQTLSAADISVIAGEEYELSCDVSFATFEGGLADPWASLSITLDGQVNYVAIPKNTTGKITVTGRAPANARQGYVTIYNEGELDTLRAASCRLSVPNAEPPGISDSGNLLVNGSFEEMDADQKPTGWIKSCSGSWASTDGETSSRALNLTTDPGVTSCVAQILSSDAIDALIGNAYRFQCDVWNRSSRNDGAHMVLQFNEDINRVRIIPPTGGYETYTITGAISEIREYPAVTLHSAEDALIDNCELKIVGMDEVIPVSAKLDARINLEGPDIYNTNGPFYNFEVWVTNVGDVAVSALNLRTYNRGDVVCSSNTDRLNPGEVYVSNCTVEVTLTENDPNYLVKLIASGKPEGFDAPLEYTFVSDQDSSGISIANSDSNAIVRIEPQNGVIDAGDSATFNVSIGATGTSLQFIEVESNYPECQRDYFTARGESVDTGDIDVYSCTIDNVTSDLTVDVTVRNNIGPEVFTASSTVTVQ